MWCCTTTWSVLFRLRQICVVKTLLPWRIKLYFQGRFCVRFFSFLTLVFHFEGVFLFNDFVFCSFSLLLLLSNVIFLLDGWLFLLKGVPLCDRSLSLCLYLSVKCNVNYYYYYNMDRHMYLSLFRSDQNTAKMAGNFEACCQWELLDMQTSTLLLAFMAAGNADGKGCSAWNRFVEVSSTTSSRPFCADGTSPVLVCKVTSWSGRSWPNGASDWLVSLCHQIVSHCFNSKY